MRFSRMLAYAAAGLVAGLATAILVVFTSNKVTERWGFDPALAVAGVFVLVALPAAGAIDCVMLARRTRRGPPH